MTKQTSNQPRNIPGIIVLLIVPFITLCALPFYIYYRDFSGAAWACLAVFLTWTGLGITAGYHRLWSHLTYKASSPVQIFLMIGGTMAVQNSILYWSANHRNHHRHVDDNDQDPYSAKRGLWYSHIGWMLRHYSSSDVDYSNVPDLMQNKIIMFQHKYYVVLSISFNVVLTLLAGWLVGDLWGVVLLAGFVRMMLSHHFTFLINSLAHKWGRQPYTSENTARDNFWLALFTWGEGYHNFHHIFQNDYRNGLKWWHFDPTKWLITLFYQLGLASDLKRVPDFLIKRAEANMAYQKACEKLATIHHLREEVVLLREKLKTEYDAFTQTMQEWTKLREEAFELKKQQLSTTLKRVDQLMKERFHQMELKMQAHRNQMRYLLEQSIKAHKLPYAKAT